MHVAMLCLLEKCRHRPSSVRAVGKGYSLGICTGNQPQVVTQQYFGNRTFLRELLRHFVDCAGS